MEQEQEFKQFIRSNLPTWEYLSEADIQMEKMGGLTNLVFVVTSNKEVFPNPIVFRKFSVQEGIIDKERETKVFIEMSKRRIGPHCYASNEHYRLEKYFNARHISNEEYKEPEIRRKLAKRLANFHKIHVDGVDKAHWLVNEFNDPNFFDTFETKCRQTILYNSDEQKKIDELRISISNEEKDFIKRILPTQEVVFSHNDLVSANILVSNEDKDVMFIDYEYAGYNFRGFDIGSIFKAAIRVNNYPQVPHTQFVDAHFPSDAELKEFIEYYIAFTDMAEDEQIRSSNIFISDYDLFSEYLLMTYDKEELQKRINQLLKETKIGIMAAFYYWMIWAVKMSKNPDNDFDYIDYAEKQWVYYQKLKTEFVINDQSN